MPAQELNAAELLTAQDASVLPDDQRILSPQHGVPTTQVNSHLLSAAKLHQSATIGQLLRVSRSTSETVSLLRDASISLRQLVLHPARTSVAQEPRCITPRNDHRIQEPSSGNLFQLSRALHTLQSARVCGGKFPLGSAPEWAKCSRVGQNSATQALHNSTPPLQGSTLMHLITLNNSRKFIVFYAIPVIGSTGVLLDNGSGD